MKTYIQDIYNERLTLMSVILNLTNREHLHLTVSDIIANVLSSLENVHLLLIEAVKYNHLEYPRSLPSIYTYLFEDDYRMIVEELIEPYVNHRDKAHVVSELVPHMVNMAGNIINRFLVEIESDVSTYKHPIDFVTINNPTFRLSDLIAISYEIKDQVGITLHQHLRIHNE